MKCKFESNNTLEIINHYLINHKEKFGYCPICAKDDDDLLYHLIYDHNLYLKK